MAFNTVINYKSCAVSLPHFSGTPPPEPGSVGEPLTFIFNDGVEGTITPVWSQSGYKEYSIDQGASWQQISSGEETPPSSSVMIRQPSSGGTVTYLFSSAIQDNAWVMSDPCIVRGDLGSIVNPTGDATPLLNNPAFSYMFYNSKITDARGLRISFRAFPVSVFDSMFNGSNYLRYAPYNIVTSSGVTSVNNYAFNNMFRNCQALLTPMEFATYNNQTLGSGQYSFQSMYYGCENLVVAPNTIPFNASSSGYSFISMFNGCSRMVRGPIIRATSFYTYSCSSMFSGCYSLSDMPQFSISSLSGGNEMANMFLNCWSLVTPSVVINYSSTTSSCYNNMFRGCTSLTTAPVLPATTLASSCYASMFYGCTSLTTAPVLPATTLASSCYDSMFRGCTSLTSPPTLNATTLGQYCYSYMFYGCTNLPAAITNVTIGTGIISYCCQYMFANCTSIVDASAIILPTSVASYCYQYMFSGCISLIQPPVLPATNLTNGTYCYRFMFQNCIALTTPPILPATTISIYCYNSMFSGCTNLTSINELPALTMATYCYQYMYQNCTGLAVYTATATGRQPWRVPIAGTGVTATSALTNMLQGTSGNMNTTPTINTTYYTANGIVPSSPPP